MAAVNGALKRGLSEERAFSSAWGAVKHAGWSKSGPGGKWVKKASPDAAEVHVDRPLADRKKKPTVVSDDDTPSTLTFKITKVDEDQNLVFGWLSIIEKDGVPVVDRQGHVIDEATLEAAAYDMVLNGCDAGEMHERIGIGEGLIECMMFTKEKQDEMKIDLGFVGLWVGYKIDNTAMAKVKAGDLRAFSLGGYAVLEDMAEAA